MDFLFRIAILVLGYLYPAYKCFKVIDVDKPKFEQLHAWCKYWIIIAVFTGFERVADVFISWLPFYSGTKLAFIVYLWHPDSRGMEQIYQAFIKPYFSKHIDSADVNRALVSGETVKALAALWNQLLYYIEVKLFGMLHQNAELSSNVASQFAQDNLRVYPSIPGSFAASKMQRQWPITGHQQPLVTQSTVWPHEVRQPQVRVPTTGPARPLDAPFEGRHVHPAAQLSKHQTWPIQQQQQPPPPAAAKLRNASAATKSSILSSSLVDPKNLEGEREEGDFEMVHSYEVPVFESSSGAPDTKTRSISAQESRPRWSWWW